MKESTKKVYQSHFQSYKEMFPRKAELIDEISQFKLSDEATLQFYELLTSKQCDQLHIQNLHKILREMYSDKNIEEYVEELVEISPLLGYVAINSPTKSDEVSNYSLSIDIPFKTPEHASKIIDTAKRVLKMILVHYTEEMEDTHGTNG